MVANMLMPDAREGIAAFLGKRAPVWSDECSFRARQFKSTEL